MYKESMGGPYFETDDGLIEVVNEEIGLRELLDHDCELINGGGEGSCGHPSHAGE